MSGGATGEAGTGAAGSGQGGGGETRACPLALDALPRPLQKHADPRAPGALRLMGAKGLVPAVAPADLATLLYCLAFDPDEAVRQTATRTAEELPDRISGVALRSDELHGLVLDWLADRLAGREEGLELVLLNPGTLDATFARVAAVVPQRLAEIIRQNELRLLRHDEIIRQLCRNPHVLASTLDAACELCVRNGLMLQDVPQLVDAHRRIYGTEPAGAPAETAARLMQDYAAELHADDALPPLRAETPEEQQRKLTISQRVARMSVSEKVKLATLGNKEARTLLLRDANKLVSLAAVTSPRITDGEILTLSNSRTVSSDVLRYIYTTREFLKVYAIKAALVKNPKVPLPTALKFLYSLQEKDIRELARDRNVPNTIQAQAKAWILKKEAASKGHLSGKH